MRLWVALYLKELRDYKSLTLFLLAAVVALNVYAQWDVDLSLMDAEHGKMGKFVASLPLLPLLLSVFVLPFALAHSFSSEWKSNTHYLMFSLPVRKFQVGLCKYLAVLSIGVALFVVSATGVHLMGLRVANHIPLGTEQAPDIAVGNLWLYAAHLYFAVALLLMGIVGGMEGLKFTVKRFRGGVTMGFFILSCYVYGRLVKPAIEALDFLGGHKLLMVSGPGIAEYGELPLPWVAYTVAAGLLCWVIGLVLFEKYAEI